MREKTSLTTNAMNTDFSYSAPFTATDDETRLRLLNMQLSYAVEKSEFYRERLLGVGKLASFEELSRLPFTCAGDIKMRGHKMVCVPASQIARIVTLQSSGTTDAPKRLYFTRGDIERTVNFFSSGMSWMCGRDDRVGVLMPCASPDGIGDQLSAALERIGAVPLRYGMVGDTAALLPHLLRDRPKVLVGLPWQIRLICLAAPELRPETVLLSADFVPDSMGALLENVWGCRVLSHYGMTETGYGCAVESPLHGGMLLRRDELFLETVSPESGAPLPPGETGELVITTLRREAMPLIRYRTGDMGKLAPGDSGRIARVLGRVGAPPGQTAADEALCRLSWLLDYRIERAEDKLWVTAAVSREMPEDGEAILEGTISKAFETDLSRIELCVTEQTPGKMSPLQPVKRAISVK